MARPAARLPENAPGPFFVDDTCIDCAVCRHLAPSVFARSPRDLSFVSRQPASEEERTRALMALVACPTSSIGTDPKIDAGPGVRAFPEPVADGVYSCGFTAESSFGAWSYLLVRPEGNVLVDSPRAAEPLLQRLDEMGGVRWMFLTHRDDVADHVAIQRRFGCDRILHERDVTAGTRAVERKLSGEEPFALGPDLLAIPVPGHTPGHAVLLYGETFLFTGDHLMGSEGDGRLYASREVCWYSWPEQIRSMERLLDFRFDWVLPGHGGRYRAPSAAAMKRELERVVAEMKA
jgi:glyoxylase-like metal-dependent hydrolase (beta-lactamase superfamily II)/ferredoxin